MPYDGTKWAKGSGSSCGAQGQSPKYSPGSCENVLGIGADSIDGAVMPFNFSNGCEVIDIPDLHRPTTAGAQQHGPAGHKGQGANPVFVCIRDLLEGGGKRY